MNATKMSQEIRVDEGGTDKRRREASMLKKESTALTVGQHVKVTPLLPDRSAKNVAGSGGDPDCQFDIVEFKPCADARNFDDIREIIRFLRFISPRAIFEIFTRGPVSNDSHGVLAARATVELVGGHRYSVCYRLSSHYIAAGDQNLPAGL